MTCILPFALAKFMWHIPLYRYTTIYRGTCILIGKYSDRWMIQPISYMPQILTRFPAVSLTFHVPYSGMYFGSRVISSGKHSAIKPGMSPAVGRALYNEPELYTAAWVLCLTGQMFLKSARVFLKNTRDFLKMFHFSKRVQATKKRANTKVKARMQKKNEKFSKIPKFFSKCSILLKMFHFSICSIVFEGSPKKYQTFSNPENLPKKIKHPQKILGQPRRSPKKTK